MNTTPPAIDYKACMDACQACVIACNTCASACLKESDVQMMAACIAQDLECAQICELAVAAMARQSPHAPEDRKSTRLNSSHLVISYAVFCLKKKNNRHA